MTSELPGAFDVHDPGCTCWPHVSAGPAQEAVIEAARQEYVAGRSVPAPTLPALDPMLLEKALGRVVTRTPGIWVDYSGKSNKGDIPASRKAFARALAKAYREALRDAVYTDRGPATVDWDARNAIILDETEGGRDAV